MEANLCKMNVKQCDRNKYVDECLHFSNFKCKIIVDCHSSVVLVVLTFHNEEMSLQDSTQV